MTKNFIILNPPSIDIMSFVFVGKGVTIMNNLDLNIKIEQVRQTMISLGMSKGFTSPETIQLSERLDKLLNQRRHLVGIN